MLTTIITAVFIIGYAAIALEHPLKINKTASALLTGVLVWTLYALSGADIHEVEGALSHHLADIAQILFFLMGAMTIVELVDAHRGFAVITDRIHTKDVRGLLWLISWVTFFLSAILDNLTTAIVMVTLLRRLVHDVDQRKFFVGMVVIAANAGGAWSPIGDVTTTMLWIGGQITPAAIILNLFLPSVACLLVPLVWLTVTMKGEVKRAEYDYSAALEKEKVMGSRRMLALGVGGLMFVPVFKTLVHLPPYMGMLLVLSIMWLASELIHYNREEEEKKEYTAIHALTRIDVPSVLFFLGILLAIGSLEETGILSALATWMSDKIGNLDIIAMAIGAASAIVDNVPLVAATMGMYPLASPAENLEVWNYAASNPQLVANGVIQFNNVVYFLQDAKLWEFLAYTAGTGGSMLIIGSAAGVAVMGMEKIDFIWYIRKISALAALGYLAGAGTYLLVYQLLHH